MSLPLVNILLYPGFGYIPIFLLSYLNFQQIFIEHILCAGIVGRACNTVVNKTEQSTTLYSWSFHFSGSHVIIFSSFIVCMLNPQGPEINPILAE